MSIRRRPSIPAMAVQELYDFAHRIAISDPSDGKRRDQILEELRRLRRDLKEKSGNDLGGCLDAAVVLTAFLAEVEGAGAHEVLQIVSRLVCITAQSLATAAARPAAPEPQVVETAPLMAASAGAAGGSNTLDLTEASEVRLGEILVRLKHVTIRDVEMALLHQRQTGARLGRSLVEIGATGHEQVQEALNVQEKVRTTGARTEGLRLRSPEPCLNERPPDADLRLVSDTYLGESLIRRGVIDAKQLEEAIMVQRATGIRIGEALVEIGAITWEDLEETIRRQKQRGAARAPANPQRKLWLDS